MGQNDGALASDYENAREEESTHASADMYASGVFVRSITVLFLVSRGVRRQLLLRQAQATAEQHQHQPPAVPAQGEHQHSSPAQEPDQPQHPPAEMGAFATREACVTAWPPEATPMYGIHQQARPWEVMWHGNAFAQSALVGPCRVRSTRCGPNRCVQSRSAPPNGACRNRTPILAVDSHRSGKGLSTVRRTKIEDVCCTWFADEVNHVNHAGTVHRDLRVNAAVGNAHEFDACVPDQDVEGGAKRRTVNARNARRLRMESRSCRGFGPVMVVSSYITWFRLGTTGRGRILALPLGFPGCAFLAVGLR